MSRCYHNISHCCCSLGLNLVILWVTHSTAFLFNGGTSFSYRFHFSRNDQVQHRQLEPSGVRLGMETFSNTKGSTEHDLLNTLLHDLIYSMASFYGEDMVDEESFEFYAVCVPVSGERYHVHNPLRDLAAAWDAGKALGGGCHLPVRIKERLEEAMDTTIVKYRGMLVKPCRDMLRLDSSQLREPTHIGHSAMLILAGLESLKLQPACDYQPSWLQDLATGILSMQRPDGAFGIVFGNGLQDSNVYPGIDFYPGEAMVAITELCLQSVKTDAPLSIPSSLQKLVVVAMELAFTFYSKHYENADVNYGIWQIQAFSRFYELLNAKEGSASTQAAVGDYIEDLCVGGVNARVWKYELDRGPLFYPNVNTIEVACGLDALVDGIPVLKSRQSDHVALVERRVQNGLQYLAWAQKQLPGNYLRGQGGLGFGGTLILEQRLDVTGHALSASVKLWQQQNGGR